MVFKNEISTGRRTEEKKMSVMSPILHPINLKTIEHYLLIPVSSARIESPYQCLNQMTNFRSSSLHWDDSKQGNCNSAPSTVCT